MLCFPTLQDFSPQDKEFSCFLDPKVKKSSAGISSLMDPIQSTSSLQEQEWKVIPLGCLATFSPPREVFYFETVYW